MSAALLEGKIIGVSGLYYDYEDPEDVMWMDYFAVKPEFQGQGYGTKMLENLVKICKERKTRMLCVFTDNQKAVKFYENNNFKVFIPENEIAGINQALGASFAGAKSMVGTSGGGFDLMTEGLSFQGQSEIPLVLI